MLGHDPVDSRPPAPTLLYVMGTGRSGSTVLEILLSQDPGAFGAGELTKLLDDGFVFDKACSCGSAFAHCPVWAPIRGRLLESGIDAEGLAAAFRRTDRHVGFWRQFAAGLRPMPDYVEFSRRLSAAIHDTTGARVTVDSSKYAGRAMALDRIFGSSLRVIWLVRDPAGILRSFQTPNQTEQRPKGLVMATLYVGYVTLCCRLAKHRLADRCIVVRYEDLVEQPVEELRRIGSWAGISLDEVISRVSAGEKLPVGHLITANRLRKSGKISLGSASPIAVADGIALRLAAAVLRSWYRVLGIS